MDNISERIKAFNHDLQKDLLAIKYKRLAENPFSFFRGTCHIFYEDLARYDMIPSSPICWISGDLHLENFGSYKGDNRLVYFDLNDFNEALLAPVTWELLRMATSIFIACGTLNINDTDAKFFVEQFLKTYRATLATGKARYIEYQVAKGIVKSFLETVSNRKQKEQLIERTIKKGDSLAFKIDNAHLFEIEPTLKTGLATYIATQLKHWEKDYTCCDIAFRVAGTGSIGAARYVFLLQHLTKTKKYLFIDMKQATPSSAVKFSTVNQPSWTNEAERMITVQRIMQNNCPALLSAASFRNASYILQEMQPSADKINFTLIKDQRNDMIRVIKDMGVLTASAQLRSTGRRGSCITDELIEFGNDHTWQDKIISYSLAYAKQMKDYYDEYTSSLRSGGLA